MKLTPKNQKILDLEIIRSFRDYPHLSFKQRLEFAKDLVSQLALRGYWVCFEHGPYLINKKCRGCYLREYRKTWRRSKLLSKEYTDCKHHGFRKGKGRTIVKGKIQVLCTSCITNKYKLCTLHDIYYLRKCLSCTRDKSLLKRVYCKVHGYTIPVQGNCKKCSELR